VSKARSRAEKVERGPANPIAGGHPEFLRKLDGLRVGQSPVEGVFVDNQFLHPDLDFSLSFPEGWETQNARTYVGAREPDGKAMAVLELAGEGKDPLEAARIFEKKSGVRLEDTQPLSVAGLEAVRSAGEHQGSRLDLTWIAYGGYVFQITGISPEDTFNVYQDSLAKIGRSFRPITKAERKKIKDTRLRIVPAKAGESLEQVGKRKESTWTPEEAAVANGLSVEDSLRTGQLVKIPIQEPYTP
jgi:predicted Zn-dependent protease